MMPTQRTMQAVQPPAMAVPVMAEPSLASVASNTSPARQPQRPYDPEAAPLWLKTVAVCTVLSAITVLLVLGWMINDRF